MTGLDSILAEPWGGGLAIAGMLLVTYLCRIGGVVMMHRVRITPRIEKGLRALPGSIIMATMLPVAIESGAAGILALGATVLTMIVTRFDIIALAAGLGTLSLLRALGL